MLKVSKKKLYIARAMRYGGFAGSILSCMGVEVIAPTGKNMWLTSLIFVFLIVMLVGQGWIMDLYKCPKCDTKLLPWRGGRYSSLENIGLEKNCPDYCPHCGERIVVKITDVNK